VIELDKTLEDIGVTDKMNIAVQEVLTETGKALLGLSNKEFFEEKKENNISTY